jgi:hypothetical protein
MVANSRRTTALPAPQHVTESARPETRRCTFRVEPEGRIRTRLATHSAPLANSLYSIRVNLAAFTGDIPHPALMYDRLVAPRRVTDSRVEPPRDGHTAADRSVR